MKKGIILSTSLLAMLLTMSCSESITVETYASNLGKVYGITLDKSGNLYVTGTKDKANVIWKISADGNPEVFSEVTDEGDVFTALGIANHSENLGQLCFDIKGKLWISSTRHAGAFVVTPEGKPTKLYLNSSMSVSMKEGIEYPHGCTYNAEKNKIFIITSGPRGSFSYENIHKVSAVTPADEKLCEELKMIRDTGNNSVATIPNIGVPWDGPARGLIAAENSKIYVIGKDAIYELTKNKEINKLNVDFGNVSLWGGVCDDNSNIYISANSEDFSLKEPGKTKGSILKINSEEIVTMLAKDIGQPMGLAYRENSLYIADRLTGKVLKIDLPD